MPIIKELFIVNEVYPLTEDKYNEFASRLDKCGRDDKCQSWVKYDAETHIAPHARKVGEKINEYNKEESGFLGREGMSQSEKNIQTAKIYIALFLIAILIFSMYKKKLLLGIGALVGAGFFYYKQDAIAS